MWKWIAAVLAAFLLASIPGFIYALRTPTSGEVDIIRDRQQNVLQRLAVVETQIYQNQDILHQLIEDHRELERTLRQGGKS